MSARAGKRCSTLPIYCTLMLTIAFPVRVRYRARSDATAALFVLLSQPLVDSGHIGAKAVGILAQVSKEVNQGTMEDSIWASLCQREYPCTNTYTQDFRKRKGYRWLYKRWSTPVVKRRPPSTTLGAPACQADAMYFDIQVKYDGASLYSKSVTAEILRPFLLSEGTVGLSFVDCEHGALILGKASWGCAETAFAGRSARHDGLPVHCLEFDERKLNVTIQVYRDTDETMSCVYSSKEREPKYERRLVVAPDFQGGGAITRESKFDLSQGQDPGILSYRKWQDTRVRLPLDYTSDAKEIMNRFPDHVEFGMDLSLKVVNDDMFAIDHIVISAFYMCPDRLELCQFNSEEEKEKSGVTLHHYLSLLQGS